MATPTQEKVATVSPEKVTTEADPFVFKDDIFAPKEEDVAPKMYRGHCVDDLDKEKTEPLKKKKAAKMYRGYVVD